MASMGLLLLVAFGLVIGCGGRDDGAPVPVGYERVELDGMRFVLPSGLPVDEHPHDGSLFIAREAGTLAEQPRVVASVEMSDGTFLNAVADVRDVNVSGVRDFRPRSDVAFDVPGSDEARRLVVTFRSGENGDIPTTRTTIVARKGKHFYLFSVVIPDAKRGELDAEVIVHSLELN
jgi:hypothetical protein